jgi:hypothetical protein
MLAGMQAAQVCRSTDDIPKALFPSNNKTGTVSPISGPAIYQGHGSFIKSIAIDDIKW